MPTVPSAPPPTATAAPTAAPADPRGSLTAEPSPMPAREIPRPVPRPAAIGDVAPKPAPVASPAIPGPAPKPVAGTHTASAPQVAPPQAAAPQVSADIRVWQLVASPGSSCLQVFLGEARPARVELPVSPDNRVAPARRSAELCGFDFAVGPGRRLTYDPTFLGAARERAAPPNTRRFLLVSSGRSGVLPRRWTIGVSGGGRADRTYEQGLAE
jgi:hypothetical protein